MTLIKCLKYKIDKIIDYSMKPCQGVTDLMERKETTNDKLL